MLNRVTFTGVDNKTDISELQKIAEEYPFVEFGILISENNTGEGKVNRYPDPWLIQNVRFSDIPCSIHVCGALARNAVSTGNFDEIRDFLMNIHNNEFDRMQLNVGHFDNRKQFKYEGDIPIIIQVSDEKSAKYYDQMRTQSENVHALFDISGGRGISGLDGGFDLGFDAKGYIGFAGGLDPDNVAFALGYITAGLKNKDKDQNFWIDMESGVRTHNWFDTKKVRAVCKIAKLFIRKD